MSNCRAWRPVHLDVVRDVTTANGPLDAVAGRFDAGIHLGEFIETDMIATRLSRGPRAAIVASLRYFESHPRPKSPRDLPNHRCINICIGSGACTDGSSTRARSRSSSASTGG